MSALKDRFVEGVVIDQKEWSKDLRSLLIEAPVEPFVAGQFTQLAVDESLHLFRPYSFANAPEQTTLEFYYSVLATGNLTPLLNRLVPGDRIFVAKRPSGRFTLSFVPEAKVLWLFATGTGLGVFLSMLRTQEPWQRFEKIVLVHSVQKASGLTHQDLLQNWQRQYPNQFYGISTVTGEVKASGFFSRRITALLGDGELERHLGLTLTAASSQTMLCGNPAMVHDLSALLMLRGLKMNHLREPGHITVENYWKLEKQST